MTDLKTTLIETCKKVIHEKINSLKKFLTDVTDAANNETKSSAGDKHETARAMMQLEQEKLGQQLKEVEEQLKDYEKIDFSKSNSTINNGSFIETNQGYFLIAGSIGKIEIKNKIIYVISNKSPLAQALIGKKQNDSIIFNSVSYTINEVI